jgi:hypothetical protein
MLSHAQCFPEREAWFIGFSFVTNLTRPGLSAGALGPCIIFLNRNKSSSSSSPWSLVGTQFVTRSMLYTDSVGMLKVFLYLHMPAHAASLPLTNVSQKPEP